MCIIIIVLLNTNCRPRYSVTKNVNPKLFVIPCKNIGGLHIYNVAIIVTSKWLFIQVLIIDDNISSQVVDKRR